MNEKLLKFEIQDNGIGIKDENKNKIFKLFGCMKDEVNKFNTKGIGLGLVISRLIVNKFGGTINLESQENKGTTITFTM